MNEAGSGDHHAGWVHKKSGTGAST